MQGDLMLVGGPGDGRVIKGVPTGVKFMPYFEERGLTHTEQAEITVDDQFTVYQVFSFLEGPDPTCNARFAIPESMSIYQGIALLAANYRPQK